MSRVQFSIIREQNVTFGIVVVKDHVIDNRSLADESVTYWSNRFGCPTVLYGAQRHRIYGRRDLTQFVSRLHYSQIPWKTMAA
jgi:hypothetical protein